MERVEQRCQEAAINAEFRQLVRGKSAVEEIQNLVNTLPVSLLIMGSVAQDILLSVPCPVLAVEAG